MEKVINTSSGQETEIVNVVWKKRQKPIFRQQMFCKLRDQGAGNPKELVLAKFNVASDETVSQAVPKSFSRRVINVMERCKLIYDRKVYYKRMLLALYNFL